MISSLRIKSHDMPGRSFFFRMRMYIAKMTGNDWRRVIKNVLIIASVSIILVIIACLNEDFPPWVRSYFYRIDIQKLAKQYAEEDTVFFDTRIAEKIHKDVRILCIVLTTQGALNSRIAVINSTWGKRCNKILYVLCTKQTSPDILNTCHIGESKYHLTGKVRYAFEHSYKHYLENYDWFFKADDDTYVVMENMRFLLSSYSPEMPGYLGYHFKKHTPQGYHSGGAGYVISRQGLKQLVEGGLATKSCLVDGGDEDVEIGKCLLRASVPVLSSLDKFERETFHTDKAWQHIWGVYPSYVNDYSYNKVRMGSGCCSQFVITFHHVDAPTMILMDHLLYRTSVYGRMTPANITNMFKIGQVPPKT